MCVYLWFTTTVVFAVLFGFAVAPSVASLADRLTVAKLDKVMATQRHLPPYSYRMGCPPQTYMTKDGKCMANWGYGFAQCSPNTLNWNNGGLWDVDESDPNNVGGCVPARFPSGELKTLESDDLVYYSRWMVGGMSSYVFNQTDAFVVDVDLSAAHYAVYLDSETSINGKEWDSMMAQWIQRTNFLPSVDGVAGKEYSLIQTPGAAVPTGFGLFGSILDIFMKDNNMTKFCIFHNLPGYAGVASYADEGMKWFVAQAIKQSPTDELKSFWAANAAGMLAPIEHGAAMPPAMLNGENAIQFKAWHRDSGLPQPTCQGADGVDYALGSTSPKSPWIQYCVFPGNPDGYEGDERNRFEVPGDRLACDLSYNMYWSHAKVGRTRAQVTFPHGSDGVPAGVVWTSTTKGLGHAGMRNGFLATRNKDLRGLLNDEVGMWYRADAWPTIMSQMQMKIMGDVLMPAPDGTPSQYEQALIDWHKEVDGKIYDVVKSCPYMDVTNPIVNGEFLGATLYLTWKPAYLKMPTPEFPDNLYLNLRQYMFKYGNMRVRASKYCQKGVYGGKLFTPEAAADSASVWYKWKDTKASWSEGSADEATGACIGDDDWGQGASAGAQGSWARYARAFTAQTPDMDYAIGWTNRIAKICNGHFGDPITLARTDPTLLVDENVSPGYNVKYA